VPHPTRGLQINTSGDTSGLPLLGGCITLPRSTDKECQARLLKISCHDGAGFACRDYHGCTNGVKELTIGFIHACGYQTFSTNNADNVLPCYRHIQLLHKKVQQAWYNPRTLQLGPLVDCILKRGLLVLPKLRDMDVNDTVAFYERLQQVLAAYLIPQMPFDAIFLRNNYEGLFPPGLGMDTYAECCAAILEILPRLLPMSNTEVTAIVSAVLNASRNGYNLLWRILELFVPGFDPMVPIVQPLWMRDSTILEFCQSHLLYFCPQAKKNVFFTARNRTNIFLCAVTPSEYTDIVTTIQTSVDTYWHPDNDGHLLDQICLNEIAMLIHNNAKYRVRDIHTPWINHVTLSEYTWDNGYDSYKPLFCILQGYYPQVNHIEHQNDCALHGNCGATPRFGDLYGGHKDRPSAGTPQGRYNRPNQRRQPFKPGVQFAACK
jgi:hypothetical protein